MTEIFRAKIIIALLLVIILPGRTFAGSNHSQDSTNTGRRVAIIGVGDIMMGTSFPSNIYLPPSDDPWPLIASLAPELACADITFGNLEGPFSDNAKLEKKCRDTTICYAFRVPERYAPSLKNAGFDILSLANNHIGDFGDAGRKSTMRLLDSLGIGYAGLTEKPYSIINVDTLLVGFCAFAPNKGTININDYEEAKKIVGFLEDSCDIVIVSFHGGAEGSDYQNISGDNEIFYGENRGNVVEFARMVVDNGADIVFGHGPHVTRAVEVYNNRFIAYSLGNFLTYRRFNLSGPNGYSPLVRVETDASGKFLGATIIPVYQDNLGHVRVDPFQRVIGKLRELIAADFPGSMIKISDDGIIKPR